MRLDDSWARAEGEVSAMQLRGVGIGRGVAVGAVVRAGQRTTEPEDVPLLGDADTECARVAAVQATVAAELSRLGERVGGEAQAVLGAAAMMAQDPTVTAEIFARIASGTSGPRAVFDGFAKFQEVLTGLGGSIAERAADLADVAARIIAGLTGAESPAPPSADAPFILVASDLAPADTVQLDPAHVLGIITRDGGPTSHTAILARAKSIPTIVGVAGAMELADGTVVIADATTGVITVAPSAAQLADAQPATPSPGTGGWSLTDHRGRHSAPGRSALPDACTLADGTPVPLLANLSSPADAAAAVALGAEGVGLFRTEFAFLDAKAAPSVAEQQARYAALLGLFPGRPVVVRCLDVSADKPLSFLPGAAGATLALGPRGIRALRANEHVLRDQLTALAGAQAATDADLWVMAPMVSDAEETEYFVTLGKQLGLTTVGVMAEVPSVAVLADQVLRLADFVSIGTNDLTQYTLAADRMLGSVAQFHDPWHPAVLRLVGMLGDAGAVAGKPVGLCGEAAADPSLAVVLVGLGVTTLSMTPTALADVRAGLAGVTLPQARERAARALSARTPAEARAAAGS